MNEDEMKWVVKNGKLMRIYKCNEREIGEKSFLILMFWGQIEGNSNEGTCQLYREMLRAVPRTQCDKCGTEVVGHAKKGQASTMDCCEILVAKGLERMKAVGMARF